MHLRRRRRQVLFKCRDIGHVFRIEIDRRDGIELAQRLFYRGRKNLPDSLFVLKFDLCFGRMDIDIDVGRIDFKIDEIRNNNYISVTAYSNLLKENDLEYLENKINLNIGIRYSENEDKTLIYMATPIIKLDY